MHSLMKTPRACCSTMFCLSCRQRQLTNRCLRGFIGKEWAYVDDSILHLLRLAGFRRIAFRFDALQFLLVLLDPALQLRDVVAGVLVPAIEHVAHADERVTHGLEIFQETLVPGSRLVF